MASSNPTLPVRFLTRPLRYLVWLLLCFCLSLLAPLCQAGNSQYIYHVGITAFRDKAATLRAWQATMDYLSQQIPGTRFIAVPLNLPEFEHALRQQQLDFVITNPEHYAALESLYGISRIATLVKGENGKQVAQFGGVIFSRNDRRDLRTLEDVRGKTIVATDSTSFAAFLLEYDLFKRNGIDINKEAHCQFLGFPQDLSVMAVLAGKADIGFVRTGVLESMAAEGRIRLSQLHIINARNNSNFLFLLSTDLYPEWPIAVAPHVPIDISNQVTASLLLMPPGHPAAIAGQYYRWSSPLEYQQVQALMRAHHLYPYDQPDAISLRQVLHQYETPLLLAACAALMTLAILYFQARRLNKALQRSRRELRELAHYDTLTGLPNRNLLDDRLNQALAESRRKHTELAVCLLDLDGFKQVNDTQGHKAGDQLLLDVAHTLRGVLRESDTVARWGGDEFIILLSDLHNQQQLEQALKRILQRIAQITIDQQQHISASIGVSLFQLDQQDQGLGLRLLKQADDAMYIAKKSGGNRFAIHGLPYWPESIATTMAH